MLGSFASKAYWLKNKANEWAKGLWFCKSSSFPLLLHKNKSWTYTHTWLKVCLDNFTGRDAKTNTLMSHHSVDNSSFRLFVLWRFARPSSSEEVRADSDVGHRRKKKERVSAKQSFRRFRVNDPGCPFYHVLIVCAVKDSIQGQRGQTSSTRENQPEKNKRLLWIVNNGDGGSKHERRCSRVGIFYHLSCPLRLMMHKDSVALSAVMPWQQGPKASCTCCHGIKHTVERKTEKFSPAAVRKTDGDGWCVAMLACVNRRYALKKKKKNRFRTPWQLMWLRDRETHTHTEEMWVVKGTFVCQWHVHVQGQGGHWEETNRCVCERVWKVCSAQEWKKIYHLVLSVMI